MPPRAWRVRAWPRGRWTGRRAARAGPHQVHTSRRSHTPGPGRPANVRRYPRGRPAQHRAPSASSSERGAGQTPGTGHPSRGTSSSSSRVLGQVTGRPPERSFSGGGKGSELRGPVIGGPHIEPRAAVGGSRYTSIQGRGQRPQAGRSPRSQARGRASPGRSCPGTARQRGPRGRETQSRRGLAARRSGRGLNDLPRASWRNAR